MTRIATAAASLPDSRSAARRCADDLVKQGMAEPDYIMIQADARHDLAALGAVLREYWPEVRIHAATSCLGSMTDGGLYIGPEPGVCMWALRDPEGDYGTASGPLLGDPRSAARDLARQALLEADRLGESPALVWLSSAPGFEEAVIAGIQDAVGGSTPIVGGSAADNAIQGHWRVMGQGEPVGNGLVLTVMFPSAKLGSAFHSGYSPTEHRGRITRSQGRRVLEIDGQPAARVYAGWTGGAVKVPEEGTLNVLMDTTLWPLGRKMETIGGADVYLLSHPETLAADGALTLFTDVAEGEELVLMSGTVDTLLQRPVLVAHSACRVGEIAESQVAGMILVFCAGCMLTVKDRLEEIRHSLTVALPGVPFIAAFTFGEQGPPLACQNRHGNLMISAVMMSAR